MKYNITTLEGDQAFCPMKSKADVGYSEGELSQAQERCDKMNERAEALEIEARYEVRSL
jgi:hypothetical protein